MQFKLLAAAGVLALSTGANAAVDFTGYTIGANLIGAVGVHDLNTYYPAVYVNQFRFQGHETASGAVIDVITQCVDLEHHASGGLFATPSLTTRVADLPRLRQLAALMSNATPLVAGAAGEARNIAAAALQLGVWEILYEGSNANYDVASGNFYSSNSPWGFTSAEVFGQAQTLANGWLAKTVDHVWRPSGSITYFQNPQYQSQITWQASSIGQNGLASTVVTDVPEPEQWALLIGGFGLAGLAARRRRSAVRVAYN